MSGEKSRDKLALNIIMAISPIFAAIAIYSLFTPWVSGKLLLIGKTITAFDFPNVFWTVLIGSLAIIAVYVWGILARNLVRVRGIVLAISAVTLVAAGYFLYVYSQKPSIPGVRVSFHGGLLFCFISLVVSLIGSIVPIYLLDLSGFKISKKISKKRTANLADVERAK
jgi:hypothetical protein